MKLKVLTLMMFMFAMSFNLMATNPVTTTSSDVKMEAFDLQKHTTSTSVFGKIKNWFNKKITKAKTWIAKKLINFDFQDPSSILKMWIIALVLGIIFYVLTVVFAISMPALAPIFSILYYIFSLIGFVLFWYWIYLKFIA